MHQRSAEIYSHYAIFFCSWYGLRMIVGKSSLHWVKGRTCSVNHHTIATFLCFSLASWNLIWTQLLHLWNGLSLTNSKLPFFLPQQWNYYNVFHKRLFTFNLKKWRLGVVSSKITPAKCQVCFCFLPLGSLCCTESMPGLMPVCLSCIMDSPIQARVMCGCSLLICLCPILQVSW